MHRTLLWLRERRNRLWLTSALSSVAAVLMALAAAWISRVMPEGILPEIERDTLESLLTIVASSMLAVTTFSLSIMVSAFASAASSATPRVTELMMGDDDTRAAIAVFLSAFIYAVVAQVALGIGYYGGAGRFMLFLGTVAVLVLLLVTLIRWVRALSSLGRMGNTLGKIEEAAHGALARYWSAPLLGAIAGPAPDAPRRGRAVYAREVAYVRSIDMQALRAYAEGNQARVHVRVRPGTLVSTGSELAWVETGIDEQDLRQPLEAESLAEPVADAAEQPAIKPSPGASLRHVHAAFVLGVERNFDQDPRFGPIVLSETAQRALSPAINDPGTAIDVMNRLARLLIETQQVEGAAFHLAQHAGHNPRLTLVPLDEPALVFDGFVPIARDGAALLEVGLRMQRVLRMVADGSRAGTVAHAAMRMAQRAEARASAALTDAHEREALQAEHRRLFG